MEANRRKVIAADKTTIISSANPHDASGFHSNAAFQVKGRRANLDIYYLADRRIINGLLNASKKGVAIRLILNPNANALGQQKMLKFTTY
ncbi:MAG TPA: hypothetical protein VNM45_04020 [Bacillus sp. (in: firmicutes)]|nr:hypothetical protein [Bacillus sp. (in: firmicutes)]